MKTNISVSNFSLDESHFKSYIELNESLSKLREVQSIPNQKKVEYYAGNDILSHKGFGLSILEQLKNFEFGGDLGLQTMLLQALYQSYLLGFNLSFTTDELMENSESLPTDGGENGYVMYVPSLDVVNKNKFKDKKEFDSFYEKMLVLFPVSSESFYERASSHFTNIIYHSECNKTLDQMGDGGINNFSMAITKCLKALNEHKSQMKIPEDLHILGHMANCDCSTQGSNGKENMKFYFPEISTENNINCEYHLKPCRSNDPRDGRYYHKRIYFTFADVDSQIKTFIASIGPHL